MKRIFNFIVKCILAAIPFILAVGYIWLFPMGYMDEEFPSWNYTKQVQEGRETSASGDSAVDSLILGDSRAMADLIPQMMGDNYVNLGMGGATSIEMYYTLKHYIASNGVPKQVMIMFAPFHYSYMDNYKTRTVYFHHLTFAEAMEVQLKETELSSADRSTDAFDELDRADLLSAYLRSPSVYLPALINSRGFGRYKTNMALYEEQKSARGHALYGTADGCDDLNYEASYEHMKRDTDHLLITYYFDLLLGLCEDNGIETCLLQAPMNRASYEALHEEYKQEYLGYVSVMAAGHGEVYFETDIPCYENVYFGDSSHLNERGAQVYTEEVIDKFIKQVE